MHYLRPVIVFLLCCIGLINQLMAQDLSVKMDSYVSSIQELKSGDKVEDQVAMMMEAIEYLQNSDQKQVFDSRYLYQISGIGIDMEKLSEVVDPKSLLWAKAHEFVGAQNFLKGDYESSKTSFLKSLELLQPHGEVHSCFKWLGLVSGAREDFEDCVSYYEKAIKASKDYFKEDTRRKTNLLFSLHTSASSAYIKFYNFRKAKFHGAESVKYANESGEEVLIVSANIVLAQADLFGNNPDKALQRLEVLELQMTDSHPLILHYYNIKALALMELKSFEEAILNFEKSISFCQGKAILEPTKMLNKGGIGESLHGLGKHKEAIKEFTDLINYQEETGIFISTLSETYHMRAQSYLSLDYLDLARKDIQSALGLKGDVDSQKIEHYANLGSIHARLFKTTDNVAHIDSLYFSMAKNDSIISTIREKHRYFDGVQELNKHVNSAYASNLKSLAILAQIESEHINYDLVFKYIEGIKSYSLKELLKTDDAVLIGGVGDDILDEEKSIKYNLSSIQKKIFEATKNNDIKISDSLTNVFVDKKEEYYKFLKELENDFPNYYRFQYEDKTYDLAFLQKTLEPEELIVEYFLDEDDIYILGIEKTKVQFNVVAKPDDWEGTLDRFRDATSNVTKVLNQNDQSKLFRDFTETSSFLYKLLLDEVLSKAGGEVKNLKIIPDDELNIIPFDILLKTSDFAKVDYKNLDYLIRSYNVSYEQTAMDLVESDLDSNDNTSQSYAGFAPKYVGNSDGPTIVREDMVDLPMARVSVNEIADLVDGKAFVNEDATKSQFLEMASGSKVLHLAMHGFVDQSNPSFSKFAFSNQEEDDLYAIDVYNMDLSADLAVLSACNTGTGQIINGDGVQNLARAFRFAGVKSTIMSLWSIPDEQTADINLRFFKSLNEGQRIDEALTNAKLSYLDSAPTLGSHPFFWAGFIPSGQTDSGIVFRQSNSIYKIYLAGGLMILLIGGLCFKLFKTI